jgi:4-amino-4-deoxy-L-arabinose transferase-like glycosyltransferase
MGKLAAPRNVFILVSVGVALVFPLISFDFGITEDEQLHNQHGKSILGYFLGTSDLAVRFPLDADGRLEFDYDGQHNDLSGALNIYGGVFDLLCATTHRFVSPFGEFENRHVVNSLFGVLLVVFTGLIARRIGGWRAGILAMLLMLASPRIVAHSMNNPVDLPFASLYAFCVYFLLRFACELPKPSAGTWVPLLLGIPLATDVRIAGLVLIFYLFAVGAGWSLLAALRGAERRTWIRGLTVTVSLCAGSYLLISALWPLAHANPFTTPLMAFRHLSRLETFNALDLFEGRWISPEDVPWYFVPKWLVIGTPLFTLLGLALVPLLIVPRFLRRSADRLDRIQVGLVAFAAIFPVLFIILRDSYVYNDARHVLFAYAPLVVLCALAFETVFRRGGPRLLRVGFTVVLAATLLEPLAFMWRNHPNEGVYFSPLIGGVTGAWHRYETDFWGQSSRQAVEWIQSQPRPVPDRPVRIRLWYGEQNKAAYYIAKQPGYEHVIVEGESADWDYDIVLTVSAKFAQPMLADWPRFGTVYEVEVDGTPVCGVLLNPRTHDANEMLERMQRWVEESPSHANQFAMSQAYHYYGMREAWVATFLKAASLPPDPVSRSYATYLEMGRDLERYGAHDAAIEAFRLAEERLAAR